MSTHNEKMQILRITVLLILIVFLFLNNTNGSPGKKRGRKKAPHRPGGEEGGKVKSGDNPHQKKLCVPADDTLRGMLWLICCNPAGPTGISLDGSTWAYWHLFWHACSPWMCLAQAWTWTSHGSLSMDQIRAIAAKRTKQCTIKLGIHHQNLSYWIDKGLNKKNSSCIYTRLSSTKIWPPFFSKTQDMFSETRYGPMQSKSAVVVFWCKDAKMLPVFLGWMSRKRKQIWYSSKVSRTLLH